MKRRLFSVYAALTRYFAHRGWGLGRIAPLAGLHAYVSGRLAPEGVVATLDGHQMYLDAKDAYFMQKIAESGSYDPESVSLLKAVITPGMVAVDIGANVGCYTLALARAVGPEGQVWAFEPDPGIHDLLVRNVALNGYANVRVLPMAVSDVAGSGMLFRSGSSVHNTLAAGNVWCDMGTIPVPTTTLDAWMAAELAGRRVDFIKMDAQGAEGRILAGAQHLLAEHAPALHIEFWPFGLVNLGTDPHDLLVGLERDGFAIKLIDGLPGSPRPVSAEEVMGLARQAMGAEIDRDYFLNLFLEPVGR